MTSRPDEITNGQIDLGALAAEFLMLGLDPYPRKPGADFSFEGDDQDRESPFGALKALKPGGCRSRALRESGCSLRANSYFPPFSPPGKAKHSCRSQCGSRSTPWAAITAPPWWFRAPRLALERHPGLRFLMFGDETVIRPLLDAKPALKDAVELRHTDVAVRMDDKPSQALRHGRRKSSMWRAIAGGAATARRMPRSRPATPAP